jgi:acyl carrier protein
VSAADWPRLRALLADVLPSDVPQVSIDFALLESGLLNSVSLRGLITSIGQEWHIDFRPEDTTHANLATPAAILDFVKQRRAEVALE